MSNIPWAALKQQFGQEYENNAQGRKNFQTRFLHQLRVVKKGYWEALVTERKTRQGGSYGLILRYSPPVPYGYAVTSHSAKG